MSRPSGAELRRPVGGVALRVGGILISAGCLAVVVWWASQQQAPRLPSGAGQWWALAGSIGAYAVATAVRSERWLALLRHGGASASRVDAHGLTLAGYMGNNTLPARGGDMIRAYFMAPRAAVSIRAVIGTLVAERVLDLAFLLSLFCLLAYVVLRGIDAPAASSLALVAVALVAAAIVALVAVRYLRRSDRGRALIAFLEPMATATSRLRGRHGAAMLVLTTAIWLAEALTYMLAAAAVGFDMDPIEALYLIALASIFVVIPSGPGYVGTLDAAVVFGARAIGATGSVAVSFLLMLRFVLLVPITLAGLVVLVARYGWQPAALRRRSASPARTGGPA